MTEPNEDSVLPDSDWWKGFREALLEGDIPEEIGGIDPSTIGDRVRDALVQWLDAGPGRAIEDRLTAIEARLAAIEASQAGSAEDDATGD